MTSIAVRHKKTVSVTIEPRLYQQARDAGINLSATLSLALQQQIRESESENWKRENRAAIQELNRITQDHGLLSDEFRTF